ncbi:unnamed protein product [Ciceribacter sp. T2.26MG-112.2]|nr:unnamed protein product [Ciceribacter naphthalenivorans]
MFLFHRQASRCASAVGQAIPYDDPCHALLIRVKPQPAANAGCSVPNRTNLGP